ncbi:hypothetical protein ZOSMA_93G00810 [Zostera marina]|uniref:Tify domain-containing protein n=1 Tax=Zostera marina TaxID=29655 RepID=A0A0K9NKN3_ZOSMR|nr:hypothetical protein ZOSMA_93G00810 [Zostera marina]
MNNDISDECVLDCNEENVGTLARKIPLDSVKKSILFKENGLLDGSVLTYISKKERILEGYKKGNYIVCSCCNGEVSPSIFESHAGFASRRQPCVIFIELFKFLIEFRIHC